MGKEVKSISPAHLRKQTIKTNMLLERLIVPEACNQNSLQL